jgi:hypothetical protein
MIFRWFQLPLLLLALFLFLHITVITITIIIIITEMADNIPAMPLLELCSTGYSEVNI